MEEVRKVFRPEFVNRLDEVIVFNRLEQAQIRHIVDIQLGRFTARLAKREISIDVTDAAKGLLAEAGWDPQYGARPLKRAVQKYLEDPMARRVLAGDFPTGTRVVVDRRAGASELTFTRRLQN